MSLRMNCGWIKIIQSIKYFKNFLELCIIFRSCTDVVVCHMASNTSGKQEERDDCLSSTSCYMRQDGFFAFNLRPFFWKIQISHKFIFNPI